MKGGQRMRPPFFFCGETNRKEMENMEHSLKQYLEAGEIVGTHGVRGELRVEPWCDSADFLTGMRQFYWDEKGARPVKVLQARPHKSLLLLKLEGIETVEQGDALRGKILYLDRKDVKLPKGRYFIQDLLGLSVLDADTGKACGVLTQVIPTGANDVYEVKTPEGKTYLVPAIKEIIVEIQPKNGKLLLRPMKGLFDDED